MLCNFMNIIKHNIHNQRLASKLAIVLLPPSASNNVQYNYIFTPACNLLAQVSKQQNETTVHF